MKLFAFCFGVLASLQSLAQYDSTRILINQLGYYPNAPKIGICVSEPGLKEFCIVRDADTVFRGQLGPERQSAYSPLKRRSANFSSLKQPGTYRLVLPGHASSFPFRINANVHSELAAASIKAFYFHRVSEELPKQFAGVWSRAAGHPDTAVLIHASAASANRPAGTVVASPGGWYDAGDYNKYIVNSGITMATLLSAYEDFPEYFRSLKLNIPESTDEVPDILNEVLYNLRWMMTMQDPADGGVYHKCTNAKFDGMVMPGVTKEPRYLVQKSTAAALDFAAVLFQAARVYKPFAKQFPGLADSCQVAATKAWNWAKQYPAVLYRQDEMNKEFKPAITTGAYGDQKLSDEWFWASMERSENDTAWSELAVATIPSWNSVAMLGAYALLHRKGSSSTQHLNLVHKRILELADTLLANASKSAFQTVMGQSTKDFIWGSNSVAANQSILLIKAYLISRKKEYLHGALSNLDYVLGRNATGYCFVTGMGSRNPKHPHHRPSEADGIAEPIPGWLVGGPNPGRQDKCEYPFTDPERAFTDHVCSYASNEVAINWNAPLVYLAAAMEALQNQL